jgi:hypothetical protein
MKNLDFEKNYNIFNEFALSIEEMINVRGGEGDNETKPGTDPVKI